ncbi:MAG: hypothetical protein F6J97_01850, partial [Leptolyngbya sp. SIO4C1]|nr:hypothetical protein [Leptolyngbya sp. SIO4C1]
MKKRLRVYRTFLTGILIGLFYVILVSEKGIGVPPSLEWVYIHNLIDQKIFVLIFSGILGGVLYTIMVDGRVELPRFVDEDANSFEAGLFGDILLGIAGALVVGLFTSDSTELLEEPALVLAAKGIIGGYGSKALMSLALHKFINRVDKLEAEKEAALEQREALAQEVVQLEAEKQDLWQGAQLINQLNEQLEHGIPTDSLTQLQHSIRQAPQPVKNQVFKVAKEFRHLGSRSEAMRDRIQRMIPIFEALVSGDPYNHQYHAQLAFANKDATQPDIDQALNHLNQAIDLRGVVEKADTWKYDLNRAIVRIQKTLAETGSFVSNPVTRDKITNDLLTVAKTRGLSRVLEEAKAHQIANPIVNWLQQNRNALEQRPDAKDLLGSLLSTRPISKSSAVERLQSLTSPEALANSRNLPAPIGRAVNGREYNTVDLIKDTLQQHIQSAIPIRALPQEAATDVRIGLG